MAGNRKIPGTPTIADRCILVIRRTPGLPSYIIAERLGVAGKSVANVLQELVKQGSLLCYRPTNINDAYYLRTVYYLPEKTT